MTSRRKPPTLRVERLEDRSTPAAFGTPWPEPQALSISFAPDGTDLHGTESRLESHLGSQMSETVWRREVLRAFQTWAAAADINLFEVEDNKKPFDTAGPVQGNPWFGDIRVGARPLGANQLAVGTPFDLFGSFAGDVILNSKQTFTRGGAGTSFDLYTVALQEAGHTLGLPNSPDPTSVMYTYYNHEAPPRTGLSDADKVAIQALYGARPADRFDEDKSNGVFAEAKTIKFVKDTADYGSNDPTTGGDPYVVAGDITAAADVDIYKFTLPDKLNDFRVELRTSEISLFQGKITVYDRNFNPVVNATTAATDPRYGNLSLFVPNATAKATYYIKVEGVASSGFGVGAYRLAVGHEAGEAVGYRTAAEYPAPDYDNKNNLIGSSTDLRRVEQADSVEWDKTRRANIHAGDKDFYKFQTADHQVSQSAIFSVWAAEAEKLDPVIRVYDSNKVRVPVDVLADNGSVYTVQLRQAQENSTYYVEVAATDPNGSYKEGDYFVAIDVRPEPISYDRVETGTLSTAAKEQAYKLDLRRDGLVNFGVKAAALAGADAAVRVTVYNAQRQAIATFVAQDGETANMDLFLDAGTYFIKVSGGVRGATTLPSLRYDLGLLLRDDPMGPTLEDVSGDPTGLPGTGEPRVAVDDLVLVAWQWWEDAFSDPFFGW